MTQPSGFWKTKHAVILKETYIWGGNSNIGAGHLEICEDFETSFGGCQSSFGQGSSELRELSESEFCLQRDDIPCAGVGEVF